VTILAYGIGYIELDFMCTWHWIVIILDLFLAANFTISTAFSVAYINSATTESVELLIDLKHLIRRIIVADESSSRTKVTDCSVEVRRANAYLRIKAKSNLKEKKGQIDE
jgi:hypothetical protein